MWVWNTLRCICTRYSVHLLHSRCSTIPGDKWEAKSRREHSRHCGNQRTCSECRQSKLDQRSSPRSTPNTVDVRCVLSGKSRAHLIRNHVRETQSLDSRAILWANMHNIPQSLSDIPWRLKKGKFIRLTVIPVPGLVNNGSVSSSCFTNSNKTTLNP